MSSEDDFEALIGELRQRSELALNRELPTSDTDPQRLHEAMRYAVLNGGKRVRALLVYITARAVGGLDSAADWPACAVEFIHAYSLVHDDLPAMDDDDLRRGKPACHKAFDEATALLTGDALQTQAFLCLSRTPGISAERIKEMVGTLAWASGSLGMAGGQAIDLDAVGRTLTLEQLKNMHLHKTGALIRASVRLGALTSEDVETQTLTHLDEYARQIGLAFQIRDDILDIESDTATLGKQQGSDAASNKPTYPSLVGLEEAKHMASECHHQALAELRKFDASAEPLRLLSEYIVTRIS